MQSNDGQNTNIRRNMTTEQEKQDVWKLAKFLQRFKASSVRTEVFTQQPHVSIKIIGNRTLVTFFAQIPAKCAYF